MSLQRLAFGRTPWIRCWYEHDIVNSTNLKFQAYKQTELLKFTDWAITNMLDTMVLYPQLAQTACLSQDGVLKVPTIF